MTAAVPSGARVLLFSVLMNVSGSEDSASVPACALGAMTVGWRQCPTDSK